MLVPGAARADVYEEFGFGARAQGMGGAMTALASDGFATYYNPGGLILSRHINLSTGFSFADYALTFDSDSGGDLDDDAERIPDLSAWTLAVSSTIPLDVPDRLAFGVSVFLPTRNLVDIRAKAPSEEPEWFRYGERHDRINVNAALAVKITDWLFFGAGASMFVDGEGSVVLSAGLNTPTVTEYELELEPDFGAVVGFYLAPADWLSFGITYRSEVSFKLDFPALAEVQGIQLPLRLESIGVFTPHQVQVGVAVNPTDWLLVSLDLLWSNWSAYEDPYLVVTSNTVAVPNRVREDFDDVFSPRLGVEVAATDWLFLRGGYYFRNAVIDDQDGLTNLVDSDKHVFTFGVGFAFGKPGAQISDEAEDAGAAAETIEEALVDASFDLDLFFQAHIHTKRSQDKPPGDPVGDWDAGGQIFNFGIQFTARF